MIRIKVPATSANLGPGFDTLGLALNLYNEFEFQEIEEGLEIKGFDEKYVNKDNLVYKSMMATFDKIGYKPKGISIKAHINIPISRGLGSSAACILGGIMGANEIAGRILSKDEIFNLAVEIEGHPDNISPALFGGLTVSIMEDGRPIYNNFKVHEGLKFLALVPDFTLSTKEARAVLPTSIDYRDGINNLSRVALLLSALGNGRFDLLKYGLKDKLHQPYRGKLIKNFEEILKKSEELGALGSFLSGAGPTIMCIIEEDRKFMEEMGAYLESLENKWHIIQMDMDLDGIIVKKSEP